MAEAVTIQVEPRDPAKNKGTGTRSTRKLRAAGRVPAIVYGQSADPAPISLSNDDVAMMLKRRVHLATLAWDGRSELAVVRDVQWDYLGSTIIHLDFMRVSPDQQVPAEVALELHGTPVGLSQGGRLEQLIRSLSILAKPNAIPKQIVLDVANMNVNDALHIRDLKSQNLLPEGVTTEMDDGMLVVHIVEKKVSSKLTKDEGEGEGESTDEASSEE